MAHALFEKIEQLAEDGTINEGTFTELADLMKLAKKPGVDTFQDNEDDIEAMAPLVRASPGDWFTHHAYEGDRGCRWIEEDTFTFLGRADGSTAVKKGWFLFRIVSDYSRGICQEGSNTYQGCNGGMLDAVGAWPLDNYRNYRPDGTYDDCELALAPDQCWGFRRYIFEGSESDNEDDHEDEEEPQDSNEEQQDHGDEEQQDHDDEEEEDDDEEEEDDEEHEVAMAVAKAARELRAEFEMSMASTKVVIDDCGSDHENNKDDIEAMAPLMRASPGDWFTHFAEEGDRGCGWLKEDTFEFLGRADGSTSVKKGWFLFRIVSTRNMQRLYQEDSNTDPGPFGDYRDYRPGGMFRNCQLALAPNQCCGFKRFIVDDEDEEEDERPPKKGRLTQQLP